MPVTSASTCSQTGAVKKLRKGAISEMIIGGSIGAAEDEGKERCWFPAIFLARIDHLLRPTSRKVFDFSS
jgi:hypothetical protein